MKTNKKLNTFHQQLVKVTTNLSPLVLGDYSGIIGEKFLNLIDEFNEKALSVEEKLNNIINTNK